MLDISWIKENSRIFEDHMCARGVDVSTSQILSMDEKRKEVVAKAQAVQERRNAISKEIGQVKASGGNADALMEEAAKIRETLPQLEEEEKQASAKLYDFMLYLPNTFLPDVPTGLTEDENVEVKKWGKIPEFSFEPKQHFDLGEALGMMDFEAAARMSGARFVVLKSDLAQLERAIAQFMLDTHTTEYGYEEVSPPYLVKPQAMFGTGQLPKFGEDAFHTTNDYWLVPTSEVPLTNLVRESILDEVPQRFVAFSPCFRSEAGSAGKDTRGMIRMHQFLKVELVSVVAPEESESEHHRMLAAAESILEKLGIPYRTVLKCMGDTGATAMKTYDIEAWLPGQNTYREISSCSNCGDYQARRMDARMRIVANGKNKVQYVHTLNGSGLAVGRTLVAILENYQNEDGSVTIPDVLRPYMRGKEVIARR